ncbi:MAG TPA: hypothetical protein VK466_01980 [Terriglobales bacterium]|nr:hypothetical protein [Terriglobales bacterium]
MVSRSAHALSERLARGHGTHAGHIIPHLWAKVVAGGYSPNEPVSTLGYGFNEARGISYIPERFAQTF